MKRLKMSKYTVELRRVINVYGRSTVANWFMDWDFADYLSSEQIDLIGKSGIWDTNKLVDKILDEYYMREICVETPDYWYRRVKSKMAQIMERYAQLIWTTAIEYEPLVNVDYSETYTGNFERTDDNRGNSNSQSFNNGNGLTIQSDTPQGQISKEEILDGRYASQTSANDVENSIRDDTTTNSQTSSDGNDSYTKKFKGNMGITASAQSMIKQTRDIILNIQSDIVADCEDLFMSIF